MPISFTDDSATISNSEYSLPNDSTSLTAQTDDCILQVWVDWVNLVAGDQYQLRVYEKINGGTKTTVFDQVVTGVQPGPTVTPSLIVGDGWDCTVVKLSATSRTIAWSIRKVT